MRSHLGSLVEVASQKGDKLRLEVRLVQKLVLPRVVESLEDVEAPHHVPLDQSFVNQFGCIVEHFGGHYHELKTNEVIIHPLLELGTGIVDCGHNTCTELFLV